MKYSVDTSFERDAKKAPLHIIKLIPDVLLSVKNANDFMAIPNVVKLKGYKNAYRIKIEDYRIGFYSDGDTVVFSRLLARKEVYKKFP